MKFFAKLLTILLIGQQCHADNLGGAFVAVLPFQGNTGCNGVSNAGITFGGNVGSVWATQASYNGIISGQYMAASAMGSGNTCTVTLQYATLTSTQCTSDVSFTSVALGTIAGTTQKSQTFAVPVNITGPALIRGTTAITGTGNTMNGGVFVGAWAGPTNFASAASGTDGHTGTVYIGDISRDSDGTIDRTFWITPVAISQVGGVVCIGTPPGSGVTWTFKLARGAPNPNCAGASLTQSASVGTISGTTQKMMHFDPIAFPASAGDCVQLQMVSSGGTAATFSVQAFGLDVTPAFGGTGFAFQTAGSGAFNGTHTFGGGHWGISDANSGLTLDQQYWSAPPSGLVACGGGFTFNAAVSGGTFGVGLTSSTAAPTSTQSTADLSYTSTAALVTCGVGAESCIFPMTQFYVPPNGIFGLNVTTISGNPVMSGEFNWQVFCKPQLSGGIAGMNF